MTSYYQQLDRYHNREVDHINKPRAIMDGTKPITICLNCKQYFNPTLQHKYVCPECFKKARAERKLNGDTSKK